jgi:hypothetical protein
MRYSLVLLILGIGLVSFGLYWAVIEVNVVLVQERNAESCTAFPRGDVPPPPVAGADAVPGLVVFAGMLTLAWGIVRMRRDRKGRTVPSAA